MIRTVFHSTISLGAAFAILIGGCASSRPDVGQKRAGEQVTEAEYAVYSDAFRQLITGLDTERNVIVVEDSTVYRRERIRYSFPGGVEKADTSFFPFGFVSDSVFKSNGSGHLDSVMVAQFNERGGHACLLARHFATDLRVALLHSIDREIIFDQHDRWGEFYKLFPDASHAGLVAVSRVGFSADRTRALFYYEYMRMELWGSGYMLLLEKTENGWEIIDRKMLWIS